MELRLPAVLQVVLAGVLLVAALDSCRVLPPAEEAEPRAVVPDRAVPEDFFEAAAAGDLDRVRRLLDSSPQLLESEDTAGWDALSHAAWDGRHEIHEYLLQQGAEGNLFTEAALGPWESFRQRLDTNPIGVDSRDPRKKATALIWAVRTGNQAGCELLLLRGADISVRDSQANSVIHHAVLTGRLDLINALISAGADVEAANERGQTALHLAAAGDSFEACRLLLDGGAVVDRADGSGNTPLHVAAERGNLELCEYFLFLGARPAPANSSGKTPADLAAAEGHERIVALLEARAE
jgi:ankyrin repeat protein